MERRTIAMTSSQITFHKRLSQLKAGALLAASIATSAARALAAAPI
jgi:hypothetical protein